MHPSLKTIIAARFSLARREAGFKSSREVAEALNQAIKESTIYSYEKKHGNNRVPPLENAIILGELYGKSAAWLLGLSNTAEKVVQAFADQPNTRPVHAPNAMPRFGVEEGAIIYIDTSQKQICAIGIWLLRNPDGSAQLYEAVRDGVGFKLDDDANGVALKADSVIGRVRGCVVIFS